VPSIVTCSVIGGSGEARLIVWTPVPMLNLIRSGPGFRFAESIAQRRVQIGEQSPGPSSAELTMYVFANAPCAIQSEARAARNAENRIRRLDRRIPPHVG
jgi:hypothetical protein